MPKNQAIAVIDMGSNSVRLVVFDQLMHAPNELFNEKALCGLARGLEQTSMLDPEGKKLAYAAMARFVQLVRQMRVADIYVIATSAIRDAQDGADFARSIEKDFGVTISILSGEDEAKLAAFGILSHMHEPYGLVGDLGGGSLELIALKKNNTLERPSSYPIGPLRYLSEGKAGRTRYLEHCRDLAHRLPFPKRIDRFYAVGGAFRNLGLLHMARVHYPIKVVHHYEVKTAQLLPTLQLLHTMSAKQLRTLMGVSEKRLEILPFAAILLEELIDALGLKTIIFSAAGVREGLLYEQLPQQMKTQDALLAACEGITRRLNQSVDYGYQASAWLAPLFKNKIAPRILTATTLLAEIARYEHTSYRAIFAYQTILDSSLPAITHNERMMIAAALYYRFAKGADGELAPHSLLDDYHHDTAKELGYALRLARSLSTSSAGGLEGKYIEKTRKDLTLTLESPYRMLHSESIEKRLAKLAKQCGLEAKITCE